ncbi:hypothetical protein LDI01_07490 [Lentilactobacillus diolivorans]|uniref:Uncharacterized protein n=1 Tax=Lentilactobacillus diolivorans TaxID=179838 RepID=A0ABQ0XAM4_9LACO|nr:hypothetical protein LDI01_07490 [Lentilactobacillus diolivorans]
MTGWVCIIICRVFQKAIKFQNISGLTLNARIWHLGLSRLYGRDLLFETRFGSAKPSATEDLPEFGI